MCAVYALTTLDKLALSYASIMGMQQDLHLTGDNYQWLGSIFFLGYIAWEYPTSRLLQRLPLAKYTGANIILWGFVMAGYAGVHNFAGAAANRAILGALESAATPGFALITSQWYRKDEQGLRTAIWCSFIGSSQIVGGIVAYGTSRGVRESGAAIEAWKIIFIVWSLVTIGLGVVF